MKIYIVMRLDSKQPKKEVWIVDKSYLSQEAAQVRLQRLHKDFQAYIISTTLRGAVRKINDDSKRPKIIKTQQEPLTFEAGIYQIYNL